MSRRVVIGILILLIIGVLGGAAVLIISRLREQPSVVQIPEISSLPDATTGPQQIEDPTGDSDLDGLSNENEVLWGTNASNADTDGDGYRDGEEVSASHNPTIPSPNDKLPAGFQPGQNITPLTGSAPTTQSFDSLFSSSVDVTGGKQNITQEYTRLVPDKDKSPLTLRQFVENYPITTALPQLNNNVIIPEQGTPLAMQQYLDIAGNLDPISDEARFSLAITDFMDYQRTSGFETIANGVRSFQEQLKVLRVPPQAAQYHELMLSYSELLAGTLSQISGYNNDQVKALVALRQLDAIDRLYYPLIIQERGRLITATQ